MKRPFHNDASQTDRRAILKNERAANASTFHQFAHDEDGGGGRFKNQTPRHVVGATATPRYPAGPNWSADPTGVEPPLGVRIDEMIPVGEMHEITASLAELSKSDVGIKDLSISPSSNPPSGDEQRGAGPLQPLVRARRRRPQNAKRKP